MLGDKEESTWSFMNGTNNKYNGASTIWVHSLGQSQGKTPVNLSRSHGGQPVIMPPGKEFSPPFRC